MTVGMLLSMLVQMGICQPLQFEKGDSRLTVLVCPFLSTADKPEAEPEAGPKDPAGDVSKPIPPGQRRA